MATDSPPPAPSPPPSIPPPSKSEIYPLKESRVEELFKLANLSRLAATSTFGLKVNAIKSDVNGEIIDVGGEGDKGGGYSESKEESKKIFIPIIVNPHLRCHAHIWVTPIEA